MSATPVSISRASDGLLVAGVVALLCGLGAVAPHGRIAGLRGDARWPVAGAGDVLAESAAWTAAEHPIPISAPRQSGNGADGLDRSAVGKTTARWPAGWYHAVMSANDEVRNYLVRSSSARWTTRWYRAIMAWDDRSGYGVVEAGRAANQLWASGAEAETTPAWRDGAAGNAGRGRNPADRRSR